MDRPTFKFVTKTIEYRVYYDPLTKIGILKSLGDNGHKTPYLIVDKEVYDSIDFCSKYKVIDGKLIAPGRSTIKYKKMELNPQGKFLATKNNLIFAANTSTNGPTDRWDFINDGTIP
jgi:hypothetical protein